jgi:hypothetical protein
MVTDHEVKIITLAYLECALWASTDDDGDPLDSRYTLADLGPGVTDPAREDVRAFLELLEGEGVEWRGIVSMDQMGHDFWLTRNHHGAGFWDRGLGDLGDALTKWAHTYGDADLYVGDDGNLYL